MNLEEFKEVKDYPDYLISPSGDVWDKRQQKVLKWIKNNDFNCVNMYNLGGKKVLMKIHQIVANTFLVKPENASKIVVHKDLDRDNNHFSNLEWRMRKELQKKRKTTYVTGKSRLVKGEGGKIKDSHIVYPGYIDRTNLLIRHRSMMYRCYNSSDYNFDRYSAYGLVGVTVCPDWHEYVNYAAWFVENAVPSWVVDKDFMNIYNKDVVSYSPETCVFIPKRLNSFISSLTKGHGARKGITPYKDYNKFACSITIDKQSHYLTGNSSEDVVEQYNLLKELHLEKLIWEMEKEYSNLKLLYGEIPPINKGLMEQLEQFSMGRFLRSHC